MIKYFFITLLIFLYQTNLESKINNSKISQKYIFNYLSALIHSNNQNNNNTIKYFNSSKKLISFHDRFLENYVIALVENDQIKKAIKEIKNFENFSNSEFFKLKLLLFVESINARNYEKAIKYSNSLDALFKKSNFEKFIGDTLKSYSNLFYNKQITNTINDYGQLSRITKAFQICYLNKNYSEKAFIDLINDDENEYSRYLYFYINQLIKNYDFNHAEQIVTTIDISKSSILISQTKNWVENKEYAKITKPFSCQDPKDILSEFFFLISNLYSSQNDFKNSNFYLKLSNYLNDKFYYNLSLLAENYYESKNYEKALKILTYFNSKDVFYNWYRIKKNGQIILNKKNEKHSLEYIKKEFLKIQKPNYKILFDYANILKNFEKYEEAIEYYNLVLNNISLNTNTHANVLYRRGSCYERLKNYKNSDKDLMESININSNDPYVLNYLAYSWLERNFNLQDAINMLLKAYNKKKDDPFIIDSVGWAYYLTGDYIKAENFINQAIIIRPNDPVIMDHYADILWKLDRKLEARYFWKNILKIENSEDVDISIIKKKLVFGL